MSHSIHRRVLLAVCCLGFFVGTSPTTCADGGRLVGVERANGWLISIFVAPDPPRVGAVDVSVLLQREGDNALIEDADVAVSLHLHNETSQAVSGPATHEQATNKLLRSALLPLPTAGRWQGIVHCAAEGQEAEVEFSIDVAESLPAWTAIAPWFLWPIGIIALFGVHRLLQRQRKKRRSDQSRPEGRLLQQ